ncbi:transmembrane protease serine 11A-like [Condylostylus longicornis]|uniref:transmembrane protease serine 11A-like n=1 Tax=Condylostylus longicornis TaxID=2530218 RepID=UPI00244DE42D|nr:transmembrane protease serine 11A-like [Condylostylus longicornis]
MKNDIALIKISPHQNKTLNYTGTFSNKIKLNNFLNKQMTCNIMGFGALKYGGDYQNHLYKATVKLITNEECISILGRIMAPKFEDNTICAVGLDGEDVCQGDSGGPLICYYKGNKYLYGIVSNGLSCGERGIPSIYTLVGKYEHWINEIIN